MSSVVINAIFHGLLSGIFFGHVDNFVFKSLAFVVLAVSTGVAAILFFFSIYWLLPNRKVPWRPVVRHVDLYGHYLADLEKYLPGFSSAPAPEGSVWRLPRVGGHPCSGRMRRG